ncbi:hypothetical protein FSST1_009983 [Fusarium sambucinum]
MFKSLPVLLFAIVGSVFAQRGVDTKSSAVKQCAKWCEENFKYGPRMCQISAAFRKGPCYECGPKSTNRVKKELCYGLCVDTKTDGTNCGKCGITCKKDVEKCKAGKCVPSS